MNQLWKKLGLVLARLALSAWVGAAVLFVINGVRLVRDRAFDSLEKDQLALIRFPSYYAMGMTCLVLAFVGLLMARRMPGFSRRRWTAAFLITLLAWAVMWGDFVFVYSPLAEMITPPGGARPAGFRGLHQASEILNVVHVGLCLGAAVIILLPFCTER